MKHQFVDHSINQKYKNYIQPLNQNIFEIIDSRLKKVNKNISTSKVLDFGCNAGHLLFTASGKILPENYVGLDINADAIVSAQRKFPKYSFIHYDKYNNTFNPHGVSEMEIPISEKFDVIVCYGVFTHFFMADIKSTINDLKQKLSKDGIIIFSIWEDVDFFGYLGFLDRQLNINTELTKPSTFKNGFVMVNRKKLLIDVENSECYDYDWIESFYRPEFILKSIPGCIKLEGFPSKHPVYILTNQEI